MNLAAAVGASASISFGDACARGHHLPDRGQGPPCPRRDTSLTTNRQILPPVVLCVGLHWSDAPQALLADSERAPMAHTDAFSWEQRRRTPITPKTRRKSL